MNCKLKSYIIFTVLAVWLGAIIVFSLLFNTSDLKESFFPNEAQSYNFQTLENLPSQPTGSNLSFLSENRMSADCCPSTYSSSNGCACLTAEQLEMMNSRGGNRVSLPP
jgi:hypothetical protein